MDVNAAVGGWFAAVTVTVVADRGGRPLLSVTVSVTV